MLDVYNQALSCQQFMPAAEIRIFQLLSLISDLGKSVTILMVVCFLIIDVYFFSNFLELTFRNKTIERTGSTKKRKMDE